MAFIQHKNTAGKLTFETGVSEEGKAIYKSKTYRNIKQDASADQLHSALRAIGSLSEFPLVEVEKIETSYIDE